MELDFDKEIDALLRRAGQEERPAAAPAIQMHLDADAIAAFAEGALPEAARAGCMRHLAVCDRCRKVLSQLIVLNSEADVPAASSAIAAPVAEPAIPWYRRLFLMPNLAYVMGGLVLLFAGFMGYSVLQNIAPTASEVSQIVSEEQPASGPNAANEPAFELSDLAANTTDANASANRAVSNAANASTNSAVTSVSASNSNAAAANRPAFVPDGVDTIAGRTVQAGQPAAKSADTTSAPPTVPKPETRDARPSDEKDKNEAKLAAEEAEKARNDTAGEVQVMKSVPAAKNARLKSAGGPYRQQQNTFPNAIQQNQTGPSRRVGGKSFEQNQNVWYDTTYQGQKTINVRRGTDEYKKLDAGLRSIAESLSGTIVVVWNTKAYRIQ